MNLLISRLAIYDLIYDRRMSFLIISGLLAVITPLLLLFSLKFGIFYQLQSKLANNPYNLELKILDTRKKLDANWFKEMENNPEVKFVIPLTRHLNMQGDFKSEASFARDIPLIPSKSGDPLIKNYSITANYQIIITQSLADNLKVKLKDNLRLFINRQLDGNIENKKIDLKIVGIVDEAFFKNRELAFISSNLLIEIEQFIDNNNFDIKSFPKARIFAKDLNTVELLAKKLQGDSYGLKIETNAQAIEDARIINKVLNTIFLIIALTSIFGAVLSIFGFIISNIERKRKNISLLSLYGINRVHLKLYLIIQSIILAIISLILSYALYYIVNIIINNCLFTSLDNKVFYSILLPEHYLYCFIITIIIAIIVSLLGAKNINSISLEESLRES